MNISKPYRWAFIVVFLSLVILSGLMSRKGSKKGTILETVSLGDIVQRIDDFHLTRFKGEDIEWEIGAKNAMMQNGEDDAYVKDMDITYIPQGGTPIRLSAEKGKYNLSTNNFFAEKVEREVSIKIGHGITINGGGLTWSGDKREIQNPGKVYVVGEKFVLEGEDLVANVDSGIYEIRKNIRATLW